MNNIEIKTYDVQRERWSPTRYILSIEKNGKDLPFIVGDVESYNGEVTGYIYYCADIQDGHEVKTD